MYRNFHPGVHIALARGKMDEAQVARAMAAGELASPQHYANSWLFDLRVTGTGAAYRKSLNEYVWRDPDLYLNQGFLDRCSGLPVIIEHPKKLMLDSNEFEKRVIGSIVYPYIKGKDVWGIARILDIPVAEYMRKHQLSTSPAVVFSNPDTNERIEAGDGKHLLIEGKPSLLDHLAICDEGVWDKGGPPAGVDLKGEEENSVMQSRKDGDKIDKLVTTVANLAESMGEVRRRVFADAAEDEAEQAAEMRDLVEDLSSLAEQEETEAEDEMHEEADKKLDAKRDEAEDTTVDKKADEAEDKAEEKAEEKAEKAEEKAEEKADAKRDDAKRDDAKRDDAKRDDAKRDDEDEEEDEEKMLEEAVRKDSESDKSYAGRCDSRARSEKLPAFMKRDDESTAAYCDRMAHAVRRDRARKDAARRLSKVDRMDVLADAIVKIAGGLDRINKRLNSHEEPGAMAALADVQAKADEVYMAHGDSAPRPLHGESVLAYRTRLARKLQTHSAAWKDTDLSAFLKDANAFNNVEQMIYADALKAARTPLGVATGQLREIKTKRHGGGEMSEFVGDPLAWMNSFMSGGRTTTRLRPRPQA